MGDFSRLGSLHEACQSPLPQDKPQLPLVGFGHTWRA